jgi:hypothetical protein
MINMRRFDAAAVLRERSTSAGAWGSGGAEVVVGTDTP